MKYLSITAILFVTFFHVGSVAYGKEQLYKWTDQNGVVHFSNMPSASYSSDSETIKKQVGREASNAPEIPEIAQTEPLDGLSYDGTKASLKVIQNTVLPAAQEGNIIAINICRQTMYALGEAQGLNLLTLDSAKSTPEDTIQKWFSIVEEKANNGDTFFQTVLGILHHNGNGVSKNTKKALMIWAEAADAGYHDALLKLGNVNLTGKIVPKNIDQALKLYREAGDKGSAIALNNIGAIYFHGNGVPQDRKLGAMYYQKSAELGYAPGQTNTGLCFLSGTGVHRNKKEAIKWLKKAAKQGDTKAQWNLSRIGVVDLPMVERPFGSTSSSTGTTNNNYVQEKPKSFLDVEIFGVEGSYRHIRNCDINSLDRTIGSKLSNINHDQGNGWTPLTLAIASGCGNMTRYLVDHGADPNERHPQFNFTPLHIAVLTNQKNLVEFLIDKGADLHSISTPPSRHYWYSRMKGTPAHTAVGTRKYDILELLLQKGIDYTIKNTDGKTIYEYAVDIGALERIEKVYNKVGIPVHEIAPTVEELISAISLCNLPTKKREGKAKVIKLLETNPELVHKRTKSGSTPLHNAVFYNLDDIMSLLILNGADVNAKTDSGKAPLHNYIHNKGIAQILVDNGARVNETDSDGRTILHYIAESLDGDSKQRMVEYLLSVGAQKDMRDNSGRLPYDYALDNGFTALAEVLAPENNPKDNKSKIISTPDRQPPTI